MVPAPVTYLDHIDQQPAESRLKLVRQIMADDPLSFFKEMRAKRPVLVLPQCTLVGFMTSSRCLTCPRCSLQLCTSRRWLMATS
jgi:hypothetical protein